LAFSKKWPVIAALVGILAITFAASGCSSSSVPDAASAPKVGSCWTTTYGAATGSPDWEGAPAVSCSAAHQSYTYAVRSLPNKPGSSIVGSDGVVSSSITTAASDTCRTARDALVGSTTSAPLLVPLTFLPTVKEWDAGSRWVRCDLAEIAIGSGVGEPRLAKLPHRFSTLVATLKSTPKRFALCEDDPANNGPDGAQTTYADCTGGADWTMVTSLTMAGARGAYPGLAALKKIGATQCAAVVKVSPGHEMFAEPPTQTLWKSIDDRELDC
jgi:hypothetical protein